MPAKKRLADESVMGTKRIRVYAKPCPRNPDHSATRVYKTDGRKRYCVCDNCGETWTQYGPRAQDSTESRD